MRSLARLHAACAALFLLLAAAPSPSARATGLDALTYFKALPAENPYRDLLLRLESLPTDTRQKLNAWVSSSPDNPAPELDPTQLAFVHSLATELRAAAAHPPLDASAWPLIADPDDPDNPAAISFPGVGRVRELARLSAKAAESLPPSEAVATYAAIGQLGRQQRAGGTLIEQLTGVAIEGIALGKATERLGEFSADELQQLAASWAALAPAPSVADAVAGERNLYFEPILDHVITPGLRALIADPHAGLADSDRASPERNFTHDLRLSALMDLGGGDLRIVLENTRGGAAFTLVPGRPVEGIELVSINFPRRLALIRRGAQEAVIHLESKRIVPRQDAATRLRKMFGFFEIMGGGDDGETMLADMLARARRHPEGVDGYTRDLLAAYQSGIDAQLVLADSARAPSHSAVSPAPEDPFLAMSMPTIGKVARALNNSATHATMLQAAVHHRLEQLGEGHRVAAPADPWATPDDAEPAPFAREPTPDGGFLLRSAYEVQPGAPLTYKFAAPDAGFVRPASP